MVSYAGVISERRCSQDCGFLGRSSRLEPQGATERYTKTAALLSYVTRQFRRNTWFGGLPPLTAYHTYIAWSSQTGFRPKCQHGDPSGHTLVALRPNRSDLVDHQPGSRQYLITVCVQPLRRPPNSGKLHRQHENGL